MLCFQKYGKKCAICRRTDVKLEVHHLNYRQIFDARISDLRPLCRYCHEEMHLRLNDLNAKPSLSNRKLKTGYQKFKRLRRKMTHNVRLDPQVRKLKIDIGKFVHDAEKGKYNMESIWEKIKQFDGSNQCHLSTKLRRKYVHVRRWAMKKYPFLFNQSGSLVVNYPTGYNPSSNLASKQPPPLIYRCIGNFVGFLDK